MSSQDSSPTQVHCHSEEPEYNTTGFERYVIVPLGLHWSPLIWSDVSRYTSRLNDASSSSPAGYASSPTVMALSQRQIPRYSSALAPEPQQSSSSPVARGRLADSDGSLLPSGQGSAPPSRIQLGHAPPLIQGIPLVSVNKLPDRLRSLFPFTLFNAVQSRCFETAFNTDDNLVLSAPTGSGKTVIMELAICRLMNSVRESDFKIVYQAPTKALCSERCNDWQVKFGSLNLNCAELTGDTDITQMRNVQAANIIITTPEKWDSITRRWKDHVKLMRLVKLFLVDEVHILKESRGATLEAVVSRMKSTGSSVRFVALSATVPNSDDVAMWLGKNSTNPHLPACREVFGEDFRPVQLQKFVYGYPIRGNDFIFDTILETKYIDALMALAFTNHPPDSPKLSQNIHKANPSLSSVLSASPV
jgi:DEAD/DEAH box helicase